MKVETQWEGTRRNLARLGDDYFVPRSIRLRASGEPLPHDVELVLTLTHGRYACEHLAVRQVEGGEPVDAESLREIPVAALIRMAQENVLREFLLRVTSRDGSVVSAEPEPWRPPKGLADAGPTDVSLRHVANAYRLAYALNEPPTAWIAQKLELTRPTAKRWVALARERGFLGAAEERKAGEA